jgi:general stress protein 26
MEQKNLDIYGNAAFPWSRAQAQIESADPLATWWLSTTRPDGRPHSAGLGAKWIDGTIYFVSGEGTRKSRNLAQNPNCVFSVSLTELDLTIEGTAVRVTDEATLERVAAIYAEIGWPASASDGAITAPYSAPSAGPAPWNLYAMTPATVVGVARAEPYGATRWRF